MARPTKTESKPIQDNPIQDNSNISKSEVSSITETSPTILSQDSPKQEQIKETFAHKILAAIDSPFSWAVAAFIISIMQIAGVVNMKTALYMLVFLGVVIVVRASVKEWLSSRDSQRVFATVFLSTILSAFGFGILYAWMSWMVDKKVEQGSETVKKQSIKELKEEVAKFVSSLNNFDQRMQALKPRDEFNQQGEDYIAAKTEEERHKVLQRYRERKEQADNDWERQFKAEYNREYYTKARTLRNEMLKHIPPDKARGRLTGIYENLAGPYPIRTITSDLEELSDLMTD